MDAKKRVVVIGGGGGTSNLAAALRDDFELTLVLAMSDDGGSTGRLRDSMDSSAVGDIRRALAAISQDDELAKLANYRFSAGELKGHSMGNLLLAAGEQSYGNLYDAIECMKDFLGGITATVVPSTDDKPRLVMDEEGGRVVGESAIGSRTLDARQATFQLVPASQCTETVRNAILSADLVVIAPGNFICSIVPALLVNGMRECLQETAAQVVMITNLTNFNGHTNGFAAIDYVNELARITGIESLDTIIMNSDVDSIDSEAVLPYTGDDGRYRYIREPLLRAEKVQADPNDALSSIRSGYLHDAGAIRQILNGLVEE